MCVGGRGGMKRLKTEHQIGHISPVMAMYPLSAPEGPMRAINVVFFSATILVALNGLQAEQIRLVWHLEGVSSAKGSIVAMGGGGGWGEEKNYLVIVWNLLPWSSPTLCPLEVFEGCLTQSPNTPHHILRL